MAAPEGSWRRSAIKPGQILSRKDWNCTQSKLEQTDQFGLGSSGINCQQLGCKLCLVLRRPSQVLSFLKLRLRLFASHRLPVLKGWVKL